MVLKGFSAISGRDVTCVWFFANELFFDDNVILGFQCFGMAREIAVGDAQQFLERIEIGGFIDHQHRHDAKADAMVESLVYILDDIFQFISCRI